MNTLLGIIRDRPVYRLGDPDYQCALRITNHAQIFKQYGDTELEARSKLCASIEKVLWHGVPKTIDLGAQRTRYTAGIIHLRRIVRDLPMHRLRLCCLRPLVVTEADVPTHEDRGRFVALWEGGLHVALRDFGPPQEWAPLEEKP